MPALSVGIIIIIVLTALAASIGTGIFYTRLQRLQKKLQRQNEAARRRIYELAILNELGDRVGYSLNIEKIIDIITSSLHQFIEYSAVSYMLLDPEKTTLKVDLEESVTRDFIDEVRDRMLQSLSALLDKELPREQVEETITGAIVIEEVATPLSSFFHIPLAIGSKVVGILTIAHTKPGLYDEEQINLLYKITNQASRAVTRLQEVVQNEQRKLNAMVASMSEGVVMTDNDYRIVVVNPAAKKAIGLSGKEELTIFDFIDNLERQYDIRGKLEESIKLDRVLIADNVLLNDRFYQIVVSPVKSSLTGTKDVVLGGVVIFRDITREKEVEQLREDFTSLMAHELRSPLVGIQKIAQLLSRPGKEPSPEKLAEYLGMIDQSSDDMLSLVSDMLDVAKIEAGQFQLTKQDTNIRELITDRLSLFAAQAKQQQLKLQQQIADAVPLTLPIDPKRTQQVLNNLLSNALKFTEPGGTVTIQAFVHQPDGDLSTEAGAAGITWLVPAGTEIIATPQPVLVIAITDTGSGIPAIAIPQLFSKFRQVVQPDLRSAKRGTGLGLVVVKGIVEAHGGQVGVASKEGQGSTFYFTLPLITANKQLSAS